MKISAVIPAYNSEKTIGRAIDSVLQQSRPADEILVIDDGSTDRTAEIVHAYADRIRLIQQANAGVSVARNTGIAAAAGDWIAFLDADDEWLPDKLRLQAEHLARYPELQWTTGNFYWCHCRQNHRWVPDMNPSHVQNCKVQASYEQESFESYLAAYRYGATGHTAAMLIHRGLLQKAGLFLPGLKRMNDIDLWYRISYIQPQIGFIFEPLAVYHAGVGHSIVKLHTDWQFIDDFLVRHFELTQTARFPDDFRPCASILLMYWIRILLSSNQGPSVRRLMDRYCDLLDPDFRKPFYRWSYCPYLWNLKQAVVHKIRPQLFKLWCFLFRRHEKTKK